MYLIIYTELLCILSILSNLNRYSSLSRIIFNISCLTYVAWIYSPMFTIVARLGYVPWLFLLISRYTKPWWKFLQRKILFEITSRLSNLWMFQHFWNILYNKHRNVNMYLMLIMKMKLLKKIKKQWWQRFIL